MSQVSAIAHQHQAQAVSEIIVQVGVLSGVEPHLLANAFTIARAGTVAEHATLTLQSLPVKVKCRCCGAETEVSPNRLLCGACGAWQTQLISGDELLLARVELVQQP